YPEGASRQMTAILASGDRAGGLSQLRVPMLVIHGWDDTLITPSGGQRTAEITPGAELLMLDDMGHDLPVPLWPQIVDAVIAHGDRNP
ncbi:MAG: alpha/beta fold hydrolase, partial [Ilumatobacteraceae bacterium]